MTPEESISVWLDGIKEGEARAAQKLWDRYFDQMVRLARVRLRGAARRAADEEDVALSAFDSFCRGAEQGRFPRLHDRNDLWRLLVVITARKAVDLIQHENRLKRGGGAVLGESVLGTAADGSLATGIEQVLGREPTPELAARVAEEFERLLDMLGDDELRTVALAKMEGLTNEEIAERLGCVVRTIERKLGVIRTIWEKDDGERVSEPRA